MRMEGLDTFDTRLFCLLRDCYFEPTSTSVRRPAAKDVASMLRVDVRTVGERVRRWERRGFIKYYQLIPNYRLLGLRSTSFLLKLDDLLTKPRALEKLGLIEGVTSILDLLGDNLLVWVAYEDEEELAKRLALLTEITGARNPERFLDEPFGAVDMRLLELDWQILGSMRNHAMKPVTKIAQELKVTRKTVRAHLERLVEHNAFFVRTIFDVTKVKGLIFYGLAIALEPTAREEALRELDDVVTCSVNCLVQMVTRSGSVFFALWGEDLQGVEDTVLKAKRVRGVEKVDMWLYKRVIEYPKLIDRLLSRRTAEAARERTVRSSITR